MSKHTPGPWFAKADPNSSSRDDWVIGIEGGTIDEVAVCSKRDAALIAASPDLLAALKRIKQTGVFIGAIAQEMMDAAIAKAEEQK